MILPAGAPVAPRIELSMPPMRSFFVCLFFLPLLAAVAAAEPAPAQDRVLTSFTNPLGSTYGSWQHVARIETGRLVINAASGRGGAGYSIARDLSSLADRVPVLTITLRPDNRARSIRLILRDFDERSATWRYDLADQPTGRPIQLSPADGAPLSRPDDPNRPLSLRNITQLHIQGDDSDDSVSVELDQILLTPPPATHPTTRPADDARNDALEAQK